MKNLRMKKSENGKSETNNNLVRNQNEYTKVKQSYTQCVHQLRDEIATDRSEKPITSSRSQSVGYIEGDA